MRVNAQPRTRQKVFHLQPQVLASLDRKNAERSQKVFDQAWVYRLWSLVPMLPSRPELGWRSAHLTRERQELQNTFQTAALAFDMGVMREDLATMARDFRHFQVIAREAVRLFDIRIGPPWWITDREFLEMAYTAVMAQEERVDHEYAELVAPYWGEAGNTPQWIAESFLDHVHATEADVINQCRWHYYNDDKTVKADKDPTQAALSMLLNWQVTYQPWMTTHSRDIPGSFTAIRAFPHRAEERRLVRLLNNMTRGRPQRTT